MKSADVLARLRVGASTGAMPSRELVIAFDADDTLWHNETIFETVHARYRDMLARWHDAATVERTLYATEMRNLDLYGYGVKGFMLSAVETAIQLSAGQISGEEIRELLALGRNMLAHPVELLEGVADTLAALAPGHRLFVITKGDLRDQQRKLAKSGIAQHFHQIEIVSEKDTPTYAAILERHRLAPERFLMVGNSLKSDILPVLALGASAVHVPYPLTWAFEHVDALPAADGRFFQLDSLRDVPAIIHAWSAGR